MVFCPELPTSMVTPDIAPITPPFGGETVTGSGESPPLPDAHPVTAQIMTIAAGNRTRIGIVWAVVRRDVRRMPPRPIGW